MANEPDRREVFEQIYRQSPKLEKAHLMTARAKFAKESTARQKFLLPLLAGGIVSLFIISPSITAILSIMSLVHPLVWAAILLMAIYFWRRYIG